MILGSFLIGMAFTALALNLIRRAPAIDETDNFGRALTMFAGWMAFLMLIIAGTYGLGLIWPALGAGFVLALRTVQLGGWADGLAPFKLSLGIGALLASVTAWIGVLNKIEEIPYG